MDLGVTELMIPPRRMHVRLLTVLLASLVVVGCAIGGGQVPTGGQATAATPAVAFATPAVSGRAAPVGDVCPPGYLVKGGVSPTGERVYSDPERREYGDLKPEACFTSSSNARAAGYGVGKR